MIKENIVDISSRILMQYSTNKKNNFGNKNIGQTNISISSKGECNES